MQELDEELVLALEVRIEGAPGESRLGSDLLHARTLYAPPQKDTLAGLEQPVSGLGLLLLAGKPLRSLWRRQGLPGRHQKAGWLGSGSPAKKKNQISKAMIASTPTAMKRRSIGSIR